METLTNQRQVVPGGRWGNGGHPARRTEVNQSIGESRPPCGVLPPSLPPVHRLSDWKVIGRYLGRSVRTVQRWERELGLPVRRLHSGTKSGVFAVCAELDAWLQAQQFRDESMSFCNSEKTLLLHALEDLRQENRDLRRQLETERARKR
jgi:hypothetical protein